MIKFFRFASLQLFFLAAKLLEFFSTFTRRNFPSALLLQQLDIKFCVFIIPVAFNGDTNISHQRQRRWREGG